MNEEFNPDQEELLAQAQAMIASQGKNPEPIMKYIRDRLGSSKGKDLFKKWAATAKPGESQTGKAHGRKVKVTILEAAFRDVIAEGLFSDISDLILKKVKDLFKNEEEENAKAAEAMQRNKQLAYIYQYALKAEESIYDDDKFWNEVEEVTGTREVEKLAKAAYKRRISESRLSLSTEIIITEAHISGILQELGMEPDDINKLMRSQDLTDEDYDVSRLKRAIAKPFKRAGEAIAKPFRRAGEAIGKAAAGKASKRVKEENKEFAELVIIMADTISDLRKEKPETPEEAEKIVDDNLSPVDPTEAAAELKAKQASKKSPEEINSSELDYNL